MYKLKLIRGRSYTGRGVKVTAEKPFVEVEDKQTADCLAASGRFELIGEFVDEAAGEEVLGGEEPDAAPAATWTTARLQGYAEANGIALEGARTKAEMLERIQQAAGAAGDVDFSGNP